MLCRRSFATPGPWSVMRTFKRLPSALVWADTRLERFEAMTSALVTHKKHAGWFQSVSVLTGPNQNGTQSVKFQRVLKIIKHASATRKVDYEILTDEGDTYFTRQSVAPDSAQTIIYSAEPAVAM